MGKTMLMLGAGEEQAIAIKLAQQMGIKVIATDGNPNAVGLKIADVGIHMDIKDVERLVELGRQHRVDGVFCHAVEIPVVLAKVTKRLGLVGLEPEVAERATNKFKRLECLKRAGVPHPKFAKAATIEQAETGAAGIGFPVIMKPVDNAGSRGVRIVASKPEVADAFKEALGFSKQDYVQIEEQLFGPELSIESVVYKGNIYTPCWADRNYSDKQCHYPHIIEDGGELPSNLPKELLAEVEKVVKDAINALGINIGAAKGDIIIHNGKPYVIEMAARTSGGRFCDMKVPLCNGVNILEPLLRMALGEELDEAELAKQLQPRQINWVAERTIIPAQGRIVSIEGLEEVQQRDGIYKAFLYPHIKAGSLVGPLSNNACKAGYVIATADTREEAIRRAGDAVASIRIKTC